MAFAQKSDFRHSLHLLSSSISISPGTNASSFFIKSEHKVDIDGKKIKSEHNIYRKKSNKTQSSKSKSGLERACYNPGRFALSPAYSISVHLSFPTPANADVVLILACLGVRNKIRENRMLSQATLPQHNHDSRPMIATLLWEEWGSDN